MNFSKLRLDNSIMLILRRSPLNIGYSKKLLQSTRNRYRYFTTNINKRSLISLISPNSLQNLRESYRLHNEAVLKSSKTDGPLKRIISVDASWYMPGSERNPAKEFLEENIPGSVFFDLDEVKDHESPYPHMLPKLDDFNEKVGKLGISRNDTLVFYDKQGNFSAPRAAWTFSIFKHQNLYVLNTYQIYKDLGYPLNSGIEGTPKSTTYEATSFDLDAVISFEELLEIVQHAKERAKYTIIDARSHGRWLGTDPEPRVGLSSGHIEDSISLPFPTVLGTETSTTEYKPKDELKALFRENGITDEKPIIVLCGTGVTACVVKVALENAEIGKNGVKVYDGSWT